jgi:hypothetical protein
MTLVYYAIKGSRLTTDEGDGNIEHLDLKIDALTTAEIAEDASYLYFTNARAIAATLTGYASGSGTVSSSDSILSAINKLNGNNALKVSKAGDSMTSNLTFSTNTGIDTTTAAHVLKVGFVNAGTIDIGTRATAQTINIGEASNLSTLNIRAVVGADLPFNDGVQITSITDPFNYIEMYNSTSLGIKICSQVSTIFWDNANDLLKIETDKSTFYNPVLLAQKTTVEESGITASNGMMIYVTSTNKFRGYQNGAWTDMIGGGSGTVTSVSIVTANGISGSVATATTTPAITLTLGAITPSSVTNSSLTATRVPYTSTGGLQADNANFTWNNTNASLYVAGYLATNYKLRVGDFTFQPYALNNSFITDNSYFNGSNFIAHNTGYTSGYQLYLGQVLMFGANTVSAAATYTRLIPFKLDYAGSVCIGGDINVAYGNYTGAKMLVHSGGNVGINVGNVTPGAQLHVVALASTVGIRVGQTSGTSDLINAYASDATTKLFSVNYLGAASIAATTATTSVTTGSLINAGGFGNAGKMYVGDNAFFAANVKIGTSTTNNNYHLEINGNATYASQLMVNNQSSYFSGIDIFNGSGGTIASDGVSLRMTGSGYSFGIMQTASTAVLMSVGAGLNVGTYGSHAVKFWTADTERISIASTGETSFLAAVGVKTGAAAGATGKVGGVIHTNITPTGNVGAGVDTLFTYTVPAATLNTNKESLFATASGTFAVNMNAKEIKVSFGGTNIGTFNNTPATDFTWKITVEIFRTGAATQSCIVTFISDYTYLITYTDTAITLSSSAVFLITGEATADNDIVGKNLKIRWEAAE